MKTLKNRTFTSKHMIRALLICSINAQIYTAPMTYVVKNLNAIGPDSLNDAITQSNLNDPGYGPCSPCNGPATPNHNVILFQVKGVINLVNPGEELPPIKYPVFINGYSAPDATCNTGCLTANTDPLNPCNQPNNAAITIQINGPGPVFDSQPTSPPTAALPFYGLRLMTGSDSSIIQGLSLTNWAVLQGIDPINGPLGGAGIRVDSNNNFILGCFLGADLAGNSAPNFNAIRILGDSNTIGDGSACGRNLISGQYSVYGVVRDNGTKTLMQGNTIGLDRSGTTALMPDARLGVYSQNLTGTNSTQIIGNVISGHSAVNVEVRSDDFSLVKGNYIGTDISGTFEVLPHDLNGFGIVVLNDFSNGQPNCVTLESNIISGNSYGIVIGENNGSLAPVIATTIIDNIIGLDATGKVPVPNKLDGVWVKFGQGTYFTNNTVSGNGVHGIRLGKSQYSQLKGNWIGTNIFGAENVGNGGDGVYLGGLGASIMSFGDVIGGAKAFETPLVLTEGNIIQWNKGNGIEMVGFVQNATVDGNQITNNGENGIMLNRGATRNVIGSFKNAASMRLFGEVNSQLNVANPDTALGSGNTINQNGKTGIKMFAAHDNIIQDNYIANNAESGIELINASDNLIGAKDPGKSVLIPGLLPPFIKTSNPLGNNIADNGAFGVLVKEEECGKAVDNSILSNSIADNAFNGIELQN